MTPRARAAFYRRAIANAKESYPDSQPVPDDAVVVHGGGVPALVEALRAQGRLPGRRGPGKARTKVAINIRLSPEVIEHYRATGDGWQTRIDETLKRAVKRTGKRGA